MTSMDKAAIGWSIAIVAAGVAIAFAGQSGQDLGIDVQTPEIPVPKEPVQKAAETVTDPFADIAEKVKQNPNQAMEAMEKPAEKIGQEVKQEIQKQAAGPQTFNVSMPAGTSVPGCEETNECYIPATVRIFVGDTVSWINDDTAAHTVTSGTPKDGPSGTFDSSLVMGGATFEYTFNDAGTYDYFCMVHPWMIGTVEVRTG